MKLTIKEHAYKNAKKRCGLNKKSFDKLVQNAIKGDIKLHKTKNHLNKWICSQTLNHKNIMSVLVYDKYLLLYTNDVVISVYQIPQRLLPISKFIIKEKQWTT